MKKSKFGLLIASLLTVGMIYGCGKNEVSSIDKFDINSVYEVYKNDGGTLNFEDWLMLIKDKDLDQRNVVESITKKSESDAEENYEVKYVDGNTFTFKVSVKSDGTREITPSKDKDGKEHEVKIGENGNWFIDGKDTYQNVGGQKGQDGSSVLLGNKSPENSDGKVGDTYIDTDSWDVFKKGENGWEKIGNIYPQKKTFNVTFKTMGGVLPEGIDDVVSVKEGETIILPIPTLDGMVFKGWFDAEGKQFTNDDQVTKDLVLTAHWEEAK